MPQQSRRDLLSPILVVLLFVTSIMPIVVSFKPAAIRERSGAYINLAAYPMYVKNGFHRDDVLFSGAAEDLRPDYTSPPWQLFRESNSLKMADIRGSGLPDIPKRIFLSPGGEKEQDYTAVITFNVSVGQYESLHGVMPALFLNSIGDNWEIYCNGRLVESQMYRSFDGRIKSHRTWRYAVIPVDRQLFRIGKNVLIFRLTGDPTYENTGFYYGPPYFIDDYNRIRETYSEFYSVFICGIYLFVGIYHLMLFMGRRKNRYFLYYSGFSIVLGLYFILRSNAIYALIPDTNITTRFEYACVFLVLPFISLFLEDFVAQKIRIHVKIYTAFCLLMAFSQAVFSLPFSEDVLRVWQLTAIPFMLLVFVYDVCYQILYKIYLDCKRSAAGPLKFRTYYHYMVRQPGGNMLVGLMFLLGCGLFDIVDSWLLHWGIVATRYSFLIFTIGTALVLARDFGRLHNELSRAKTDLEEINANLEITVKRRTRELEIATESAESASRAKSDFLARMSHEIRTPLNAIIGLSEIELQKENDSADSRTNLEQIFNSGSLLLNIINEILDISKIEAGRFELNPVEYRTAALIGESVSINMFRIGSKPIAFQVDADSNLPSALAGDELRVKQILNNLLSNAFKYTREGEVILRASFDEIPENPAKIMLVFSVKDSGIGIREEDKSKLFGDYIQLDMKSNRKVEGTGLGLAITRGLASMMGGDITVESEYGRGSVFTVRIIQDIVDKTPIGAEGAENLKKMRYAGNFRSRARELVRTPMPHARVLVVDDVEANLSVARGLLGQYKIKTDCVRSGGEAIAQIREVCEGRIAKYDIILMDHMMPGMDGIETVRIIRSDIGPYAATVPIIALTANAVAGNAEMFLSRGFNDFISKPIDVIALDTMLRRWISPAGASPRQQADEARGGESGGESGQPAADDKQGRDDAVRDTGAGEVRALDMEAGTDCYGSMQGYLEIVRSFRSQAPELIAGLAGAPNEDLSAYAVTVHGIKGALYAIFAKALGDRALELEKAAKSGDRETLVKNNSAFIADLISLLFEADALEFAAREPGKQETPARSGGQKHRASPDPKLMAALSDAVASYNTGEISDIISELEEWEYDEGADLVAELRAALEDLDYDRLMAKLRG